MGNFLTDIGTRASQEEPRSSIGPPDVQKNTPDVERVFSKETMDPELSIASATKLTKTIRVAGDTGYAVGKGATNIGTRENQEKPRSSIALLRADKHPVVERGLLDKEDGPRVIE